MLLLKSIIGWIEQEGKSKIPDIEKCRPEKCPFCGKATWESDILWIIGHGTYQRWAYIPNEIKVYVRRFFCKNCKKTCSVFPHGILPRFQYSAHLILSCLRQFYVDGKTEAETISNVVKDKTKQNCGLLHRWGTGFLIHSVLWGWPGAQLGVIKDAKRSRDQIRIQLERFFQNFKDRVTPNEVSDTDQIIQISLSEMFFDKKKAYRVFHTQNEKEFPSCPMQARFSSNTENEERQRSPPRRSQSQ